MLPGFVSPTVRAISSAPLHKSGCSAAGLLAHARHPFDGRNRPRARRCARQVGHQGAKTSTRIGFPSFCAALNSAWVNGFQSAALAGSEPSMAPARMPAARKRRCAIICCEPPVWSGSHIAARGSSRLITME